MPKLLDYLRLPLSQKWNSASDPTSEGQRESKRQDSPKKMGLKKENAGLLQTQCEPRAMRSAWLFSHTPSSFFYPLLFIYDGKLHINAPAGNWHQPHVNREVILSTFSFSHPSVTQEKSTTFTWDEPITGFHVFNDREMARSSVREKVRILY